ncbi:MAG: twin-arginine translocase subunit TatC [Candidatus Bathyarchaeia archaeon]
MTFWEHTEELIRRLKIPLYTLIVVTIVVMVFPADLSFLTNPTSYQPLIGVILKMIREHALPPNVKLIGTEFVAPIELYFVASFFFGLAAATPVLAYEIFKFIDPALYPHEKRTLYSFMITFLILFSCGLVLGYFLLVPYGIAALMPFFQITGAEPLISVTSFYYFTLFLTLMTGIVATFPVFLTLLVKFGILQTRTLTKNRRYVYFALLVLVFLITPGEGGLANFMLLAVMVFLFEAGILFAKRYEKKGDIRTPRWQVEAVKCRYCGNPISANVTFCPQCGKSQK